MLYPADQTIVLLDIDNTLVNSQGQLNKKLLEALKSFNLTRIVLFSSYDLSYRLRPSAEMGLTRWDVQRRLAYENIDVMAIIISASPYHEISDPQTIGSYYKDNIENIERAMRSSHLDPTSKSTIKFEDLTALGAAELTIIEKNIHEDWGGISCWQGDDFKGGKQHMLTHTIQAYRTQAKHYIVIDDKKEVAAVVQRAIKEKTYGSDILLNVLPVNFTTVYSDSFEYYINKLSQYFGPSQLSPKEELPIQKILGIDEEYLEIILEGMQNTQLKHLSWFNTYDRIIIWFKTPLENCSLHTKTNDFLKGLSINVEIKFQTEKNFTSEILSRLEMWSAWYQNALKASPKISYTACTLDLTWLHILQQELRDEEQFSKEVSWYHYRLGFFIKALNASLQNDFKEKKIFNISALWHQGELAWPQQRRQYLQLLLSYAEPALWGWFLSSMWKSPACKILQSDLSSFINSSQPSKEKLTSEKIKLQLLSKWTEDLAKSNLSLVRKDRGKLNAEVQKGKALEYVEEILSCHAENLRPNLNLLRIS